MKYKYILTLVLFLTISSCLAQSSKNKKNTTPAIHSRADVRFEEMIPSTQRILFIDSVVVNKGEILSTIALNPEIGKADSVSYTDGRELRSFYCSKDRQGKTRLYTANKIAGKWGDERIVSGLDSLSNICYPFMLADGVTLCFAAKSNDSLGGLDIYMTRYDDDDCSVMEPECVGLPFCSKSDDYIYYIDDRYSLGFFVSERNQDNGKACIYIFATNAQRLTYNINDYDYAAIEKFAHINSIRDTWRDNIPERIEAMDRLKEMRNNMQKHNPITDFTLVVSDNIIYHSWANFRSDEAKNLFLEATTMKTRIDRLADDIEGMRKQYSSSNKKDQLYTTITNSEASLLDMRAEYADMTKKAISRELEILNGLTNQ